MLTNKQQEELNAKLYHVWETLDEFMILMQLIEMTDEQLSSTKYTFDPREERIQLLLNCYRNEFKKHFAHLRKLLLEIDEIPREK